VNPQIVAQLDLCNGKRKKLRLTYEDVMGAVEDAASDPHGIGVRHAGADLLGRTTICLVVKHKGKFVVGIQGCYADRPTPGRAWKELQPWQQDFAKNAERAQKWAAKKAKDRVAISGGAKSDVAAKPKKPTGNAAKLLAAILADPSDDQARLVYADFLTQSGDPRGEFITVQIALAGKPSPAQKRQLNKRQKELLKKHRRAWEKEALQDGLEYELVKGFVGMIKMTGAQWGAKGAKLLAKEPIERLVISKPTTTGLAAIAKAPHTAKLRRLENSSPMWIQNAKDVTAINELFRSKHVGAVKEIWLHCGHDPYVARAGVPDVSKLFDKVSLAGVESLALGLPPGCDDGFTSLATISAPKLTALVVSTKKKPLLAALKKAFPKATVK
jgi:uncharacterized protein (TIGR02996 family)